MGFFIQVKCKSCGYHTPDDSHKHCLIDPMGMQELLFCVCHDCHELFQRDMQYNEGQEKLTPINRCVHCGSENITFLDDGKLGNCPKCCSGDIDLDCLGTFF